MKKLVVLLLLSLVTFITKAQHKGVQFFEGTFEEACVKAKAENKPIFIDFYTDWCKPCIAVATYVFPSDTAGQFFNTTFINLKVNAEKDNGVALAKKFAIDGYPTFIVLNPDKTVQVQWSGASMKPTPAAFIKTVKSKMQIPAAVE